MERARRISTRAPGSLQNHSSLPLNLLSEDGGGRRGFGMGVAEDEDGAAGLVPGGQNESCQHTNTPTSQRQVLYPIDELFEEPDLRQEFQILNDLSNGDAKLVRIDDAAEEFAKTLPPRRLG